MNKLNKTTLLGIIFITIGLVFAMNNFDIIPWHVRRYIYQWENILMLVGIFLILTDENKRVGGILFAIGLIFVIDDWFYIDVSIWDLWPIVFIIIGVTIIRRKTSTAEGMDDGNVQDRDLIDDTAIFSGGDKVINSQNFKGGNLTAIFGGSNIDLTTSKLSPSSANIEIFYLFGGSKIRVPQDWNVELRVTSIFGAMTDKRVIQDNSENPEKLYIKGLVVFGGAEITN
ncbi:hypothetical protein BFP97_18435 [Roseivirga sp. 4D4]|uniref:LiaF transmembrane domain-containing protein n=1 Tax=Roseivirga sp. 4D4 TaxID=1889784 RepID=UPI0008539CF8|nr:DUF5668 domain-containing protein [Roseivirga sp. 4D4]OEK03379.1 hypothetical protein BFP97_18435 [Roseivirga sp. 4D4]